MLSAHNLCPAEPVNICLRKWPGFTLTHKILHFGSFSNEKMTPQINQCVLNNAIKKKRNLLKSEIAFSKCISDFPRLIIASFINNAPIETHQCLLYLLGRNTARQLRGRNCWGVRYCIHGKHISHIRLLSLLLSEIRKHGTTDNADMAITAKEQMSTPVSRIECTLDKPK